MQATNNLLDVFIQQQARFQNSMRMRKQIRFIQTDKFSLSFYQKVARVAERAAAANVKPEQSPFTFSVLLIEQHGDEVASS
jgi:hypothetical protein